MNEVQKCQLDIMKAVDLVCKNNDIPYFAIGGTLLGAIRHKGFIPWDDDIDIGLSRENFKRFCEVADRDLPEYYRLRFNEDPKNGLLYAKIHDIRTAFIEAAEMHNPERFKGIFIDVFPYDGMPNSRFFRSIYTYAVKNLVRAMTAHRVKEIVGRANLTLKEKLVTVLPYSLYYRLWRFTVTRHKFSKSKYTTFTWSATPNKLTVPTEYFVNLAEYDFEGFAMPGSLDYDSYLSIQFGNYMELPPEDKRQVHSNGGIVDVNKSYLKYKEEAKI